MGSSNKRSRMMTRKKACNTLCEPRTDEIPTSEKQVQLPCQADKRILSFSINDWRRIVMGLQWTRSQAANHMDLPGFDDEMQRKSESCSDSVPMSSTSRNNVKLLENFTLPSLKLHDWAKHNVILSMSRRLHLFTFDPFLFSSGVSLAAHNNGT
ncbi:hypothetical protein KSP39_PZI023614 [Platanthera zijinensis]|uniref:Uncharacterized protein n=1 Tax=Platanthera zijinensis TaxID=2320716 RepID=A0AAP0AU16_9ASPA